MRAPVLHMDDKDFSIDASVKSPCMGDAMDRKTILMHLRSTGVTEPLLKVGGEDGFN